MKKYDIKKLESDAKETVKNIDELISKLTYIKNNIKVKYVVCAQCKKLFGMKKNVIGKGKGKIYCSDACKSKAWRERNK